MYRRLIALLMVFSMTLLPLFSSDVKVTAQSNGSTISFPQELSIADLASGVVDIDSAAEYSLIFERITMPVATYTSARQVNLVEVLYIEKGELTVTDSIGITFKLGEGKGVYLRAGATYETENLGLGEVSLLRLRLVKDADEGLTAAATPEVADAINRDVTVTVLSEYALTDLDSGLATIYLSQATLKTGDNTGQFTSSNPVGVMIASGVLTVGSPSGLDGQLSEGNVVVLPANQALSLRNDSADDATILFFGIVPASAMAIAEVPPTPTPIPPTPTPEPTEAPTPTPEPTAVPPTPTPDPAAGTVLYEANASGGFEDWPTAGGWHVVADQLVNDGSNGNTASLSAAPFDVQSSDYAVEAEIQWNRDGTCFGVFGRKDDRGGYYAGPSDYCGNSSSDWDVLELWAREDSREFRSSSISHVDLGLDNGWHLYRIEFRANTIKVFVDGSLMIETSDNKYLSSGKVGVWTNGAQINVRSFKVISLGDGRADGTESNKIVRSAPAAFDQNVASAALPDQRRSLSGRAVIRR